MQPKEANARIKINNLLSRAGWVFENTEEKPKNIELEPHIKIDEELTKKGFIDFLLLDDKKFPLAVIEAKKEDKDPLDGKEQARTYADNVKARFIILSNGDLHYFWDLKKGNPEIITEFPTQESLIHRLDFKPDKEELSKEKVEKDYIALTQNPRFKRDPQYQNADTQQEYLREHDLKILRDYQLKSIHALQQAAKNGKDRFLFEMATGTGKTLISAAIIKLFLRTGNATRVLFLVDRLELEQQATKNFIKYLENDYSAVIYKQHLDDWKKAEIVISTVQSLSSQNKYKKLFSPTDFDLIITDESHRVIGENTRAILEYFIGYKLGLTATPKNYLKNADKKSPNGDWERRHLLDTYATFDCENAEPTFRYGLLDGINDEYLIKPAIVGVHTDITTELLSKKGYAVMVENDDGDKQEAIFFSTDFERKLVSEKTNTVFCETFLQNALKDPISGEIGKSIIFCISQNHASKITHILNKIASRLCPDKYNSDFAVQVTSNIPNSQQFSVNFANNNLSGHSQFVEGYKTSKTRICVTVSMMTTGYDCQDILNLALMRPIFSPIDFVQIRGRGTRKYDFIYTNEHNKRQQAEKTRYKLFDFFDNCKYFEEEFNYDEELKLPTLSTAEDGDSQRFNVDDIEIFDPDKVKHITEIFVGPEGMKIDRKLFEKAKETLQKDNEIKTAVDNQQWDAAVAITRDKYENKPELYLTLEKIRKSENVDYRITWRDFLERVFDLIPKFKSKDELLDDECEKFITIQKPESKYIPYIKNFLKAYITNNQFKHIINEGNLTELNTCPSFSMNEYIKLNDWKNNWKDETLKYINDSIPKRLL